MQYAIIYQLALKGIKEMQSQYPTKCSWISTSQVSKNIFTNEWLWDLNSNYCPEQRGFNFIIHLRAFMTIQCTETSNM